MRRLSTLMAGMAIAGLTAGACLALQRTPNGAAAPASPPSRAILEDHDWQRHPAPIAGGAGRSDERQAEWLAWISDQRRQIAARVVPERGQPRVRSAPAPAQYSTDIDCMTAAIYYEARSEPRAGQAAVAQVVMNRVASRHYPNSVCEVVFQNNGRFCQFTFACDGAMARGVRDLAAWGAARDVAQRVLAGERDPVLARATHYHTTAIYPRWAPTHPEITTIGAHVFRTGTEGSILS